MYANPNEIHFIPGHEWNMLHSISKTNMRHESFSVHSSSDRMGYHLKGIPLTVSERTELLSSGVSFGTIQLLPNGQLIVLMADLKLLAATHGSVMLSQPSSQFAQLRPGRSEV